MNKSQKHQSLRHFIYRVLVVRILIVALLISVVLAGIVYFNSSKALHERVLMTANDRFETLRARTNEYHADPKIGVKQAVNQALSALEHIQYDDGLGHFVYYVLQTDEEGILSEKFDPEYPYIAAVKTYIQSSREFLSQEIIEFEGRLYIPLQMPFYNKNKQPVGTLNALFALSDATIQDFENRLLKAVLYAVLIVFAVTALLYPVVIALTRKLASASIDLLESNIETLQVLGNAIAKRDSDTNAHNYRVTIIAVRLAETIGLEAEKIAALIKGAFLHDVGKIAISDNILLKPGRLTEEEFAVMKTHVEQGIEIVDRSAWLADAQDVVGGHHEKYDGSGYPGGLVGQAIPVNARIFAIADVFDALCSERPYKKPIPFEKTMTILEQSSGSHFDPGFLDSFRTIAQELQQQLTGLEEEQLRQLLDEITAKYYSAGLDSLRY